MTVEDHTQEVEGSGYHDHNWGNMLVLSNHMNKGMDRKCVFLQGVKLFAQYVIQQFLYISD
ncbi:hypothetical protein [Paenibacillus terrae]|uniref:hypothetical protein n=1 Tax=Paenibacillus terrae TaxID=159743 RepID=UPI0016568C2E|nr:hypothetical protein [Paenibacillus terrae]